MFYYKKGLIRRVRVHPKYMEENIMQMTRKVAKEDIKKNNFTVDHGYIVQLICISDIGKGKCLPLHGFIEFPVTFDAVVFYPVVGEVVDAEVVMVTDGCITFRHVCVYGVVRSFSLNNEDCFEYEEVDKVAEAEKASFGVIKQGLYRSQIDEAKIIGIGSVVRVKICCRTLGGDGFFLNGSMCGEFLGPVKNPPPISISIVIKEEPDSETEGKEVGTSSAHDLDNGMVSHSQLKKMWKEEPYNTSNGSESPRPD